MMEATRLLDWDQAGLALGHAARAPWLDSLFAALTWLGSLAVLLPLALLMLVTALAPHIGYD
jgi:hypothetical protein